LQSGRRPLMSTAGPGPRHAMVGSSRSVGAARFSTGNPVRAQHLAPR
jgi:hypothetical protein